jgi:hypothetical protein
VRGRRESGCDGGEGDEGRAMSKTVTIIESIIIYWEWIFEFLKCRGCVDVVGFGCNDAFG